MPDVGKRIIILWYIGEKKLPGGTMKAKKVTAIILAGAICAAAFTGCGINTGATAASMKNQTVTMGMANFTCRYQQANVEDYYQVIVQMLEKKNLYTRPLSPKERQEKRVKMFKEDSNQFNVREKMYIYFYDISNIVGYVFFTLPMLAFGFWMIGYGQLALVSILLGVGFFIFLTLIGKEPKV